ncbi:MAG: hypothetical protein [Microviridae sp.]|nr:MAG: hypothetical protein [Microviridae sp.]
MNTTNRPAQERLISSMSAEEQDTHKQTSSEELISRNEIEGTPFTTIGNNDHGYFLSHGILRLSPTFNNPADVTIYLNDNYWGVIISLIAGFIEINNQLKTKTETK